MSNRVKRKSRDKSASRSAGSKKSRTLEEVYDDDLGSDEEEVSDEYEGEEDEKEEAVESDYLSYRWLDSGKKVSNGQEEHSLLEICVQGSTTLLVSVGDTVRLRSEDDESPEGAFVAKVERMWQDPSPKSEPKEHGMKIRARWYFKKKDVQQLRGSIAGPITKQQLVQSMTGRDLILSDQCDDNDVLTLMGKCAVIHRRSSTNDVMPDALRDTAWVSRYSIAFEGTGPVLMPYDGENQPWPELDKEEEKEEEKEEPSKVTATSTASEAEVKNLQPDIDVEAGEAKGKGRRDIYRHRVSSLEQDNGMTDESSWDEQGSDTQTSDDDGKAKGKINIGPDHQVEVPQFREGQQVVSRKPQLTWKREQGKSINIDNYLQQASDILLEYLEKNDLLPEEPYFPLPHEEMETFLREHQITSMSLSNLSTGSSMSEPKNKLTRECKIDSLLELLHSKEYNAEEALKVVRQAPQDYVTSWTRAERQHFNRGFRRYSGSLRMIPTDSLEGKNFKDVVDYHYRFKIPDQFRRYQDRKREHAIRMMHIIESRKNDENAVREESRSRVSATDVSDDSRTTDWSKTPITDVVGVVEDRRTNAKKLLMDIQQAVGTDKMSQICRAIKSLDRRSVADLKEKTEEILHGHPELLDRFLGYLPKQFRS